MEITLRKANALQLAINEAVKALKVESTVTINEFQDGEAEIRNARGALGDALIRRTALVDVLYQIRKDVSAANASANINDILADVAALDKDIAFYNSLSANEVRIQASVLEGKLARLRDTSGEHRYYNSDVNTSVLTSNDVNEFRGKVALFKKEKQRLQDKLLELNVSTKITLSTKAVAVLEKEGLL